MLEVHCEIMLLILENTSHKAMNPTWMSQEVDGSMVRINGLFMVISPLINGVLLGVSYTHWSDHHLVAGWATHVSTKSARQKWLRNFVGKHHWNQKKRSRRTPKTQRVDSWRSPFQPWLQGHVNSPSQKGHVRRIARYVHNTYTLILDRCLRNLWDPPIK